MPKSPRLYVRVIPGAVGAFVLYKQVFTLETSSYDDIKMTYIDSNMHKEQAQCPMGVRTCHDACRDR